MGYDAEYGHPNFGKTRPCPDPSHNEDRLRRLAAISNLSGDDLFISLDDIARNAGNAEMLDACQQLLDMPKPYGWLYLYGGPGNAKTIALKAIVNACNRAGIEAMYCRYTTILDWMRQSFSSDAYDADYVSRFKRLESIKVLAIDEMDKARETDFASEFRFAFFDHRYETALQRKTVTVFASNSAPSTLPEALEDRVKDGRFLVVENKQPSARGAMTWD